MNTRTTVEALAAGLEPGWHDITTHAPQGVTDVADGHPAAVGVDQQ